MMRLRLITLITVQCFCLMTGPNPSAATQEGRNVRPGFVPNGPGDKAPRGVFDVPCTTINIGTETKFLPDLELLDQNNRRVHFYGDLIKDKIVLISFFYTSCTYTCLMQGKVFAELQAELGERLGKEVFLISVTRDPQTDTPERLKAWGARNGVRRGWTLVTGGKDDMAKLVAHLTGDPLGRLEMHSSFIYIGNDKKNKWDGIYGLDSPKELVRKIEEMKL